MFDIKLERILRLGLLFLRYMLYIGFPIILYEMNYGFVVLISIGAVIAFYVIAYILERLMLIHRFYLKPISIVVLVTLIILLWIAICFKLSEIDSDQA